MQRNICTRRNEEMTDDECRVCFTYNAHLRTAFNGRRMGCVDANLVSIASHPPPPPPHLDSAVQRLLDAGYSREEVVRVAQGMLIIMNTPCAEDQNATSPNNAL